MADPNRWDVTIPKRGVRNGTMTNWEISTSNPQTRRTFVGRVGRGEDVGRARSGNGRRGNRSTPASERQTQNTSENTVMLLGNKRARHVRGYLFSR